MRQQSMRREYLSNRDFSPWSVKKSLKRFELQKCLCWCISIFELHSSQKRPLALSVLLNLIISGCQNRAMTQISLIIFPVLPIGLSWKGVSKWPFHVNFVPWWNHFRAQIRINWCHLHPFSRSIIRASSASYLHCWFNPSGRSVALKMFPTAKQSHLLDQ